MPTTYPPPVLSGTVVPPLTADLTWTSSGSGGDPDYADVVYIPMDSAHGFTDIGPSALTVTVTNATIVTSSPSPPGGATASGYFNGSNARLSVPIVSGGLLDMFDGTTPFTIEFFVYPASGGSGESPDEIFAIAPTSNPYPPLFELNILTSSGEIVGTFNGSSIGPSSAGAVTVGAWQHVALTYDGTTASLYVAGVRVATLGHTSAVTVAPGTLLIGWYGAFTGDYFEGNLADFRTTKGVARYSGASFTPPAAPLPAGTNAPAAYNLYRDGTLLANINNSPTEILAYDDTVPSGTTEADYTVAAAGLSVAGDPDFADVSLLLTMDGSSGSTSFPDSSSNALTATPAGCTVDTSEVKFGTGSALFNNALSQSQLLVPITAGGVLDFTGVDFTAECWFYIGTLGSAAYGLLGTRTTGGTGFTVNVNHAGVGQLDASMFVGGVSTNFSGVGGYYPTVSVNTWHALALVRQGNVYTVYLDGVTALTLTDAGGNDTTSGSFSIGITPALGPNSLTGNIDEVRVTKGVARYTADYTPATTAFPTSTGSSGADESPLSNVYEAIFATPIVVPNVIGDTVSTATIAIDTANFTVGSIATVYSTAAPAGIIIGQTPAGGSLAAPMSAISLIKSLGPAPIIVPDLTGLTQPEANAALVAVGLVSGGVSSGASAYPAGEVFQQSPAAGSSVAEYSLVSYVLSTGVVVPSTAFDWEATVISQYANSPTILQILSNMGQYFDERQNMADFFEFVWNVNTAVGFGLDIWGRIVDISRLLQLPDSFEYFGFHNNTTPPGVLPFNQGVFNNVGGAATDTYLLPDDAYRTLILVKALANVSATTAPAINQLLKNLFPGRGQCYVQDDGGMAMTFQFNFVLSPTELAILGQSGALPHPAGVSVSIVSM